MDGETEIRGIVTRSRRRLSVEPDAKPAEATALGTPSKRKTARGVSAEKDVKLPEENSAATPTKRRPTRGMSVILTDLAEDAILVTPSKMTPNTKGRKSILPQETIIKDEVLDTPSKRTRSRKSIAEEPLSDSSVRPNTPTNRNARIINACIVNSPIRRMSRRYSTTGNENVSADLEVVPPNKRTRTVSSIILSPKDSSNSLQEKSSIKDIDLSILAKERVEKEQDNKEDLVPENSSLFNVTIEESVNVIQVYSPQRSVSLSPVKKSVRLSGKSSISPCKTCPGKSDLDSIKKQINKSPKKNHEYDTSFHTNLNTSSKIQSLSRSLPNKSNKKTKLNNSLPVMKLKEVSINLFGSEINNTSKLSEVEPMDVDESFDIINEEKIEDPLIALSGNNNKKKPSKESPEKSKVSFNSSLGSNKNLHDSGVSNTDQTMNIGNAANKTKEISINIHNDDNTSVKVSCTSLSTSINITKNSFQESGFTTKHPWKSEEKVDNKKNNSIDLESDFKSLSPKKSRRGSRVSLTSNISNSDSNIKNYPVQILNQNPVNANTEENTSNNKMISKSNNDICGMQLKERNDVTQFSPNIVNNMDSIFEITTGASLTSIKNNKNSNSFNSNSVTGHILSISHNKSDSTDNIRTLEISENGKIGNMSRNKTINAKPINQSELLEKQNISNKCLKDKSTLEGNLILEGKQSPKRFSKTLEKEIIENNSITTVLDTIKMCDTDNEYPKEILSSKVINDFKKRPNLLETGKDILKTKSDLKKLHKSYDGNHSKNFDSEILVQHVSFEEASDKTPKKISMNKKLNLVTSTPNTDKMHEKECEKEVSNVIQATEKDSSVKTETSTNDTSIGSEDSSLNSLIDKCDEVDKYESGDSMDSSEREFMEKHEIKDLGETLDTQSSISSYDMDSDKDSFIISSDDEEEELLLSGTGDDLSSGDDELNFSAKSKNKYNEKVRKVQKKASREMYQSRQNSSNLDSQVMDSEIINPKINKNKPMILSDEEPCGDSDLLTFDKLTNDSMEIFNVSNNSQNITVINKKSKKSLDKSKHKSLDNLKSDLSFDSKVESVPDFNKPLVNLITDTNTESSLSEGDNVKTITSQFNAFLENLKNDHNKETNVEKSTDEIKLMNNSFINKSINKGKISKSKKSSDVDKSVFNSEKNYELKPLKKKTKFNISELDESNLGIDMLFKNKDFSFESHESKENLKLSHFNKDLNNTLEDVIPLKRAYGEINLLKRDQLSNDTNQTAENNKSINKSMKKSNINSDAAKSLNNSPKNEMPLKKKSKSNSSIINESDLGIDLLFQSKDFSIGKDELKEYANVSQFNESVFAKKPDNIVEDVGALNQTSEEINLLKRNSFKKGYKNVKESQGTTPVNHNKGNKKIIANSHDKEKTKLEIPILNRLPDSLLNSLQEEGQRGGVTNGEDKKKKKRKNNVLTATIDFIIEKADNNKIPLELDMTFVDEEPPTYAGDTGKIKVVKKSKIHVPFVDYKASRAGSTSEFNVVSSCSTTKFKIVTTSRNSKNYIKTNEFLASHVINFKNDRLFGPNVKRQSVRELNQENEKLLASGRQHVRK